MPVEPDPVDCKRRLSRAVLSLPGVAGVGQPERGLTVYLVDDSSETRGRIAAAIGALKLPVEVHFEVTGQLLAKVPRAP
jgi:hypothetical protein